MANYFVHEQAICESVMVGENTRIWAFSHVLPKAVIGADCNICDGVLIENDVLIGKHGNIDLMKNIPIEAGEIEELMNGGA